jgi:rare lipoprotein A (peptidoglycan hydrolase)
MTGQAFIFLLLSTLFSFEPSYNKVGYVQKGVASYYAEEFHGKKTANGEKFNMNDFTAAHPRIRFNTLLKVTNLDNGKEVMVRINDRGPYVGGRILDLSRAAAQKIDMIKNGTTNIKAEVIAVEQFGGNTRIEDIAKRPDIRKEDSNKEKKQSKIGGLLSKIADALSVRKKNPAPVEEPQNTPTPVITPKQQEKPKQTTQDKPLIVEPKRRETIENKTDNLPKKDTKPQDKPLVVEPKRPTQLPTDDTKITTPVATPTAVTEDKFEPMNTYNIWATEKFPDGYGVQIGSFTDFIVALSKAKELQSHNIGTAYLQVGTKDGKKVYRILLGEGDVSVARGLIPVLQSKGYSGVFVKQHY